MTTEELKNFFEEKDFNVNLIKEDNTQCAEMETWTNGGVNMLLCLKPFTIKEFENHVNDFDIDEEIDLNRQAQDYKNAFTIKESVKDFEDFHNRLKDLLSKLQASQIASVGDIVSFTYKGGRKVSGEVLYIDRKDIIIKLKTDYIGKNEEWEEGEKKMFHIKECKKFRVNQKP